MAVSIDERVVEMRFDNKRFEENVRESIDSLQNLDDSINDLSRNNLGGLSNMLKVVVKKFAKLVASVSPLTSAFYAIGNVSEQAFKGIQRNLDDTITKSEQLRNALDDNGVVEVKFSNGQFKDDIQDTVSYMDALDRSVKNLDYSTIERMDYYVNDMDFESLSNSIGVLQNSMNTFGSSGQSVIHNIRTDMENLFIDQGINNELDHISFNNLLSNLDIVKSRMSGLGIVGMTVIQDLTRKVEDLIAKMIKVVNAPLNQIKTGGWSRALNIQDAKFQLEGLGVAWDNIKGDIDYAVSGTAYGLDAAAKAASQLVASGVELGDSMKAALRGISGVAAMANVSYEEISPIFTTVAGQGKLMTMQLRQLEARGLNVAATLGKSLGKSEQAVRDMVSDGKINFDMFAKAMDDAFGQHAKDANKTFTGSMSNMKTALSRIGAEMADTYMTGMIDIFNDLRTGINDIHVRMQPVIDEINNWIEAMTNAASAGLRWIMSNEDIMVIFDNLADAFFDISNAVANFILTFSRAEHPILNNLKDIANIIGEIIAQLFGLKKKADLSFFEQILTSVLEILYKITSVVKNVLAAILNSEIFQYIVDNFGPLIKMLLPALITYLILSKTHLLRIATVMATIMGVIYAVKKFNLVERMKTLIATVKELTTMTINNIKTIVTKFGPLAAVIGVIWMYLHKIRRTAQLIRGFMENTTGMGVIKFITGITGAVKGWTYSTRMLAKINMIKAVVLGIVAIAATAALISKYIDVTKFGTVMAIMGVMLAEMILVVMKLDQLARADDGPNFGKVMEKLVTLAAMAGIMIIVGKALSQLAVFDWDSILAAGAAISMVGIALSTSLAILSGVDFDPTKMFSIAAALAVVAVGLSALTVALSFLAANANDEGLWNAVKALGALALITTVAVGALSLFPQIAGTVILVGIGLAAALIGMGTAAIEFAFAAKMVTEALVQLFDFLVANKDSIAEALTNMGIGVLNMVKSLGESVITIGNSLATTLVTTVDTLITGVIHIVQNGSIELLDTIEKVILKLFEILTVTRNNLITFISDTFVWFGYAIRHGMEGLYHVLIKGEDIGKWVGMSVAKGMIESTGDVTKAAGYLGYNLEEGLRNQLQIHSESPKFHDIGAWVTKSLSKGIVAAVPGVMKYVVKAGLGIAKLIQKGLKIGVDDTKKEEKKSLIDKITSIFKGDSSISDKLKDYGIDLTGDWASGVEEGLATASDKIKDAFSDIWTDISSEYGFDKMDLFGTMSKSSDYRRLAEEAVQRKFENDPTFKKLVKEERAKRSELEVITNETTDAWKKEVDKQEKNIRSRLSKSGWLANLFNNKKNQFGENNNGKGKDGDGGGGDGSGGGSDGDKKTKKTTTLVEKLVEALKKASAAFNDFDRTVKMSTDDLFSNVNHQIQGLTEWGEGVEILMKRGFSKQIIEEIMSLGPEASYKYVSTLLEMTPKQMKKYNKKVKKSMSLPKSIMTDLADSFTKNGKHVSKAYLKGVRKGADDAWDEYHIGNRYGTMTGKALKDAFKAQVGSFDFNKLLKKSGIKSFTAAVADYFDGVSSKSKKAQKATSEYITAAYMATLDESKMQEALNKDAKDLAKDVKKWWKEQQESVETSVFNQIRAMEDLDKAYDTSGKDYKEALEKRNKDYAQAAENQRFLLATGKAYGLGKRGLNYIRNLDNSDVLSLIDAYQTEFGGDLDQFGAWFVKTVRGGVKKEKEKGEAFEALLETGKQKDVTSYLEKQKKKISEIKQPADRYADAINGIVKGIKDIPSSSKTLTKFSSRITEAFQHLGKNTDVGAKAIKKYAKSLLELRKDDILEETAEAGVDVTDVIKKHLDEITDSIEEWQASLKSALKSAVQSFEEFDTGEKKSLDNMIKNLQGNITKLNEWRANLKKMQELGYSSDLINYMASQGLSSYREVEAFVGDVSQSQIDEINQLWDQAADQSEESATDAFGATALALETVGRDTVDGWIDEVAKEYAAKSDTVKTAVKDNTEKAVTEGLSNVDVSEEAKAVVSKFSGTLVGTLLNVSNAVIPQAVQQFAGKFFGASVDSTVEKTGNETKKKAKKKGKQIGKAGVLGAVEGLNATKPALGSAVDALCDYATNKAEKKLGIASPSKVFAWIGEKTAEGFAVGFGNNTYMATDAVDDFSDALVQYAQKLSDDLDNAMTTDESEWTIKPVLDLDNLQNAQGMINSMLGNGEIGVRSSALASQIGSEGSWDMLSKALSNIGSNTTTNTYGDIQITVNAPEGTDANEIANAVMTKIQQSIDRRKYI